ncbi:MAG TPA: response regulator transcription factor [Dehalococcoidia bacterium]|nr:response regulator transcription factor [Dehalococcoidia bacterium]
MTGNRSSKVRIYVIEEQDIYTEAYKCFFPAEGHFTLMNVVSGTEFEAARQELPILRPDVVILSTKRLDETTLEQLRYIRTQSPDMGVVLITFQYNIESIPHLKSLAASSGPGMALLLRQSLDRIEQLHSAIWAVTDGQVILDPVLGTLMFTDKEEHPFMKLLTPRELEVMGLLAEGYTNTSMADALCIDIRTVQHHIENMYSKLRAEECFDGKHPRVSATRLYLETSGKLMTKVR